MVLLNTAIRNETTPEAEADAISISVDLSPYVRRGGGTVKRMTSPGLDSKDSGAALWAGQSYASGVANGTETIERLERGIVTVGGSEGVLVFF